MFQPAEFVDKYLHLEQGSPETLAWSAAQSQKTAEILKDSPHFQATLEQVRSHFQQDAKLPYPTVAGGYIYAHYTDKNHERGLWRRMLETDFLTGLNDWEILVDFDQISKDEGRSWIYAGGDVNPMNPDVFQVDFSDAGSDQRESRFYSLSKKAFLDFKIPPGKHFFSWYSEDTLVGMFDVPGMGKSEAGYVNELYLFKMNGERKHLYSGALADAYHYTLSEISDGLHWSIYCRCVNMFESEYHIVANEQLTPLPIPRKAWVHGVCRSHLVFTVEQEWTYQEQTFEPGALLVLDLRGGYKIKQIMASPKKGTFGSAVCADRNLVVTFYENIQGHAAILKDGPGWEFDIVTGDGFASINRQTVRTDSTMYISSQTFIEPNTLYKVDAGTLQKTPWSYPKTFDSSDLTVEQHWATSKDGTQIPYFLIINKNKARTKTTPVLVEAYGGFAAPMTPYYHGHYGKCWLSEGGAIVVANIRGGGEFGPEWHTSAIREKRQNAYDDLAAVVEHMHASGVSSPAHTGFEGHSNGGLLAGVMLTQRPDLFGAIISGVPLLDMIRYVELPPGSSWIAEYGDPRIAADREVILKYSPYQQEVAGKKLPPSLFPTSTKDDRVNPAHARKMVARLQEYGHNALLFEKSEGGHGGADSLENKIMSYAVSITFLKSHLFPKK